MTKDSRAGTHDPRGGRIRLAAVAYRNAWPLLEGLDASADVDLVTATPSDVASILRNHEADAGLVPSIELLRQEGLEPVASLGIAAFGPVDSVLLLLRRAPHRIRTLALDPASRTSHVLASIILDRVFGVRPRTFLSDPDAAWSGREADAVLVIGDRALRYRAADVPALDLADAWSRFTSLPFVFAVWGATSGVSASMRARLETTLAEAHARGLRGLRALAQRAASSGPLDARGFEVYLEKRIRYGLGEKEMRGLRRFLDLAAPYELEARTIHGFVDHPG